MKTEDIHAAIIWLLLIGIGVSAGFACHRASIGFLAFCLSLLCFKAVTK